MREGAVVIEPRRRVLGYCAGRAPRAWRRARGRGCGRCWERAGHTRPSGARTVAAAAPQPHMRPC